MLQFCEYSLENISPIQVLLLNLISMDIIQAAFFVSNGSFQWSEAGIECTIGTPKLTAIEYKPTVYSVVNINIDVPDNEEIWTGFYQVVRVFEYIGCIEQENLFYTVPEHVEIKGDPGHCFPRCGESKIVAVTKSRCFCLGDTWNTTRNTKRTGCTHSCNHPLVACGFDNDKYSYLSIYKINPIVDHSTISPLSKPSGDKDCLCLDPTIPKTYYWQGCATSLLNMCNNGINVVTLQDDEHCDGEYRTWLNAANCCLSKSYSPTNFTDSKQVNKREGSQLWTGCFKTLVTYKHDSNIPTGRRNDQKLYGYLYKDKPGQIKVQFTNSDAEKRVLCRKGWDSDIWQTTTKDRRRLIPTSAPYSNVTSTADTDNDTGGMYIALGVSVAALVITVAFIVLTIGFLKRRHKQVTTQCNNNEETLQGAENNYSYPDITMATTSQDSNSYFVLEPHVKKGGTKIRTYEVTDDHRTYDSAVENRIYDDTIENTNNDSTEDHITYDTTSTHQKHGERKTDHVYNQLYDDQHQTYDHTFTRRKPNTVQSHDHLIDDTYDSSANGNQTSNYPNADSIYNKTVRMDEGVYNHVGHKLTHCMSDNVYGMQSKSVSKV